ncbi:hypothetical protein DL766_001861 [Monosporascus sp. MC13-8B]|uniref:Ketoreductase (KR) domain-containing protein n=1 Tax=Monosporascus cannonballus TaxID=155416 RepID=A0ABY0HFW1_9PEZI|nr:hypothetical protein DL762_001792 [Monosporascus cannonballus]RYO93796.1 hypothetical protein DL763_004281 [Monosporascus cannonballus]RYP36744.1 hypothetical protein DL766_001861 [Monosporascus sp. MC13-8B]
MANPKGTILLTGANGGLGCGIVSKIISTPELAQYHGVYVVRNASVASALKSTLKKAPASHSYEILPLELSLLANIKRMAESLFLVATLTRELQRRLDTDPVLKNISITGIDPGTMGTGLVRRGNWFTRVLLWPIILPLLAPLLTWLQPNGDVRTIGKSSADVLTAAFETGSEVRGKYFNGSEPQEVVPEAANIKKRAMVWRDSVKYAQLTEQDTTLVNWT